MQSDADHAAALGADARPDRQVCRELHDHWTRVVRTADDRVQTGRRNRSQQQKSAPTAALTDPKLLAFEKSRLNCRCHPAVSRIHLKRTSRHTGRSARRFQMPTPASHVWKPSSARSVTIDSFVPVPRGSNAVAPPLLNWPTKDPGDTLDYEVDISPALVGNDGDSIATIDVTVFPDNPGDLSVSSTTADGTRCVFWLTEGQSGIIYTITMIVTTANGRTIQRSVLVPVLNLSVPPIPPDALETDTGAVVTDQNGNPILAPSS